MSQTEPNKTKIRGPWPFNPVSMADFEVVDKEYSAARPTSLGAGQSKYMAIIEKLLEARPASRCVQCPTVAAAKALAHAVKRVLVNRKVQENLMISVVRTTKGAEVWLLPKK